MIEKIKDLLKQYNRSIIFYFDTDESFKEALEAIALEGLKVVTVKDNYFERKI
ncbi:MULTISPECIES: hypothetical protein [unclassified Polaribacter]|uniref:hypothetical protein n=1 Tax=unclassified Polaribacter TaxID=196858 RepID=UPI0016785F25|nr:MULTISPECIES: hypothetical protein [unclassified Polaribacter]